MYSKCSNPKGCKAVYITGKSVRHAQHEGRVLMSLCSINSGTLWSTREEMRSRCCATDMQGQTSTDTSAKAACQNGTYPMQNYSVDVSASRVSQFVGSLCILLPFGRERCILKTCSSNFHEVLLADSTALWGGDTSSSSLGRSNSLTSPPSGPAVIGEGLLACSRALRRERRCLSQSEVLAGYTCDPTASATSFDYQRSGLLSRRDRSLTPPRSWDCAYNIRYKRGDCTSGADSKTAFYVCCLSLFLLSLHVMHELAA
eukprot:162672-Hanusia_phi.AAC.2